MKLNPGQQRAVDELLTQDKRYNLLYGGSRSGKSALLVNCDITRALTAPGSRHLICRKELSAARASIAVDTFPKVWKLMHPDAKAPKWYKQDALWVMPNEAEIWLGGLNDDAAVEKMLGREYATIHGEEISEWHYGWFSLLITRLAQVVQRVDNQPLSQRFYGSLNPTNRVHWSYRLWQDGIEPEDEAPVDRSQYGFCQLNPKDNAENLSPEYLEALRNLPARQRKRFWDGNYSADDENALWRRAFFKRAEPKENGDWPVKMRRIVVAIDPAVSVAPGSDETGIVAVGLGVDGNGYVLEDESGKYRPEEWARRAISLYQSLDADRIIGEVNNGGDLIEHALRAQNPSIPFKAVRATKGKVTRAEPVAALYERGKMYHVGYFPELEDQMCSVTVGFDAKQSGWSPDRVDAAVWAAMELFPALSSRRSGHVNQPISPEISIV